MILNKQKSLSYLLSVPLALFSVAACTQAQPAATVAEKPAQTESQPAVATMSSAKLNVNEASQEELLAAIPDLGDKMVDEFADYRPYASIQQFREEIGKYVDEATIATYEEYIFVPIDMNEADAATLMQIPGVDQAAADEIISKRPFDTVKFFLAEVEEYAPEADIEIAQSYLMNADESTASAASDTANSTQAVASPKLNVNDASKEELLAAVPGLGDKMVDEFADYRPYASIQQFRQEIGKYVEADMLAEYEEYIFVPIHMNEADAATLMQIPGVDEVAAEQVIAKRPFDAVEVFMGELAEYAPNADLDVAAAYLVAE